MKITRAYDKSLLLTSSHDSSSDRILFCLLIIFADSWQCLDKVLLPTWNDNIQEVSNEKNMVLIKVWRFKNKCTGFYPTKYWVGGGIRSLGICYQVGAQWGGLVSCSHSQSATGRWSLNWSVPLKHNVNYIGST